jgi:DNA-binding NtrC family response regulator
MTPPAPRILIADDQPDLLEALRLLLKGAGYLTVTAHVPEGVMALLEREDFDAVLMDLNYTRDTTSGREGLDLLTRIQVLDANLPVVVMTAWGSVEKAVEAMQRGARGFIEKPWDNARLLATLQTQVELGRALRRGQRLETENRLLRREGVADLVAESPAMRPVVEMMERVGPSDANVLITGEHGTGKEVVAGWLHAASARAARPLVTVNVGGLSDGVFESELFGHVKGPSPMPRPTGWDGSSWPTAGPSSSTKSPTFPSTSSPNCCACSRPGSWNGWAPPVLAGWMPASWPPPTPISGRR